MQAIADTTVLQARSDHLIESVDDDLIVVNMESGHLYGLSGTARAVWDLLIEPKELASVCDELARRYQADPAVCRKDLSEFVQEMLAEGLLCVAK